MQINLNIDTNEPLSGVDLAVLRALAGDSDPSAPVSAPKAEKAAAPKATPAPKAEKAVEEPVEEDVAEEGDVDPAETALTKKDAVALATKLVSSGKAAEVKKVLTDLGAKRVSELSDEDVPAFIAALS